MKKFTFLFVFALIASLIISYDALGQITQRGTETTGNSTNTNLTINKPSGVVTGDVMIVNIAKFGNTAADPSLSGWSLVTGATGIIGDGIKGSLLYKVATASEPSDYTFALGAGTSDATGSIVAFYNVDVSGSPFDVIGTMGLSIANGSPAIAPGITTTLANSAVVMFAQQSDDKQFSNWTATNPATLTQLYVHEYNSSNEDLGVGAAMAIKATAGATGQGSVDLEDTNDRWGAILIALKQAPPSLLLTPTATQNIGVGSSINFTAIPTNYTGSGNHTFTWTATGATIPAPNPATSATTNSKNITFPATGTYNVIVQVTRGTTDLKDTTVVNVYAPPATPNLWAASSSGTIVSSFSVTNSVYFAGPTTVFTPTFPGTTTGGTSTAAIARSDKPSISLGHYYWLPNTSGNSGVVEIFGATSTGASQTRIGSLDLNGGGDGTSLGFVRLGIGPDGTAWILAGSGTQLYLAKIKPNGVMLNGSLPVADQLQVVDDNVSLVGGAVATFQNGDVCILGNGNIYALANNGSGVTQIFIGAPNGSSTTLTKKWDLVNPDNSPFTGQVNGVAFSPTGSLYISTSGTDQGLYYIDAETVNGPAGTVQTSLVIATPNIHDLASNVFPTQSTLPVTLSGFSVYKSGNNAILDWKTSNELNTDHFEIERSYDGIYFNVIGIKQAAGNSSSDVNYQYIDPITISSGNIYYRLKTLDLDGKSSYSKIVVLRVNGGIVKDFTVYPNPFTSNLKMEINSEKEVSVVLRLSNSSGQVIMNRNILLQKGTNVVVLSSELQNLNPGIHILEVISDDGKMTQKIIKR